MHAAQWHRVAVFMGYCAHPPTLEGKVCMSVFGVSAKGTNAMGLAPTALGHLLLHANRRI